VVVLFIFVGNFGVSKVIGVRSQITSAQNSEATLTQKLNLLQTLSTTASAGAPVAASAVPDANPALSVISQLKTLALQNGVVITGIKSTSGVSASSGMSEAAISFAVDGAIPSVFDFLAGTATVAPIMVVDKITIAEALGSIKADVSVKSYWADFPKTIPSIDAPVTDLTAAEKKTLTTVTGLTQPAFTQVTASQEGTNPNPFGQ